ncbi:MAG: hypothetical protein JJV98_09150 [Desulfosarcina sp.]|nr:hypothetical protein [Desulfobacterales bacterium]
MISDRCDFNEFVLEARGRDFQDIIYLAEREATEAERRFYHSSSPNQENTLCWQDYAQCLKGFITYMRYGIKPAHINHDALILFDSIRDEVQM